jgi:hypothetical protein
MSGDQRDRYRLALNLLVTLNDTPQTQTGTELALALRQLEPFFKAYCTLRRKSRQLLPIRVTEAFMLSAIVICQYPR